MLLLSWLGASMLVLRLEASSLPDERLLSFESATVCCIATVPPVLLLSWSGASVLVLTLGAPFLPDKRLLSSATGKDWRDAALPLLLASLGCSSSLRCA